MSRNVNAVSPLAKKTFYMDLMMRILITDSDSVARPLHEKKERAIEEMSGISFPYTVAFWLRPMPICIS